MLAGKGVFCSPRCELPRERGSYVLIIKVTEELTVRTKYGQTKIQKGIYAYVGSAFGPGGLRARISRHWRKEKKLHWHIDWITTSKSCEHRGAWVFPKERAESELAQILAEQFTSVPGFGASDSKEDSHLFRIC